MPFQQNFSKENKEIRPLEKFQSCYILSLIQNRMEEKQVLTDFLQTIFCTNLTWTSIHVTKKKYANQVTFLKALKILRVF